MSTIPRRLLPQTVTVEPYIGTNGWGEQLYDPPATWRARVQSRRQLVRSRGGDEVVSETTITLPAKAVVPLDSRITLPDGTITHALTYGRLTGAHEVHHVTVTCS